MLAKLAGAETTAEQTTALEPIAKYVAGEPADHPDHDRLAVVPVQLAELRRLADAGQPVRNRSADRNQQQFRFRHRRGSAPAPAPAGLMS